MITRYINGLVIIFIVEEDIELSLNPEFTIY